MRKLDNSAKAQLVTSTTQPPNNLSVWDAWVDKFNYKVPIYKDALKPDPQTQE